MCPNRNPIILEAMQPQISLVADTRTAKVFLAFRKGDLIQNQILILAKPRIHQTDAPIGNTL